MGGFGVSKPVNRDEQTHVLGEPKVVGTLVLEYLEDGRVQTRGDGYFPPEKLIQILRVMETREVLALIQHGQQEALRQAAKAPHLFVPQGPLPPGLDGRPGGR